VLARVRRRHARRADGARGEGLAPRPLDRRLPRLARLHRQSVDAAFRDSLTQGVGFALFLTVPAAVGLLILAEPLAHLMAVGRMGSGAGTALVATSTAALSPGIIGETVFLISTYACYARHNTRAPLRSMLLQAGTFATLAAASLMLPDVSVTAALALAFSAASIVGAWHLAAHLRRGFGGVGWGLTSSARRISLGVLTMAGPVWLLGAYLPAAVGGRLGSAVAVTAATVVGVAVYLSLQMLWHAPELRWLAAGVGRLHTRPAVSGRRTARAGAPNGGPR